MPSFRIVKRDDNTCFLWVLPNKDRIWATEAEFEAFCEDPKTRVITPNGILGGRYLRKECSRDFCGDYVAHFVATFPDTTAAEIGPWPTDEQERKRWWKEDFPTYAAIFGAGFVAAWMLFGK